MTTDDLIEVDESDIEDFVDEDELSGEASDDMEGKRIAKPDESAAKKLRIEIGPSLEQFPVPLSYRLFFIKYRGLNMIKKLFPFDQIALGSAQLILRQGNENHSGSGNV